eukprot:jgi/Ulvmu1/2136/UM128_0006.1
MLSIWSLFVASVLGLNSVCILNDKRVLERYNWGMSYLQSGASAVSLKYNIVNAIVLCRVLRDESSCCK